MNLEPRAAFEFLGVLASSVVVLGACGRAAGESLAQGLAPLLSAVVTVLSVVYAVFAVFEALKLLAEAKRNLALKERRAFLFR